MQKMRKEGMQMLMSNKDPMSIKKPTTNPFPRPKPK